MKYELILMLDSAMQSADRKKMLEDFEKDLKDLIQQTDEIGMKNLVTPIQGKNGNDKAYFVSYCMELDQDGLAKIRESLKFNTSVVRYKLFKMLKDQPFHVFADLEKKLEKEVEGRGKMRFGQKISFFAREENKKYLDWKSIVILHKYLTRFGDIKPRRYTSNTISRQKKVRRCIIRARELGVLEYLK